MCLCLYKVIADFYFLHHQRKQFSYSAIPVPGNANAAFYLRIHLKMLPITQTREYTKIPIIATETWRHIRKDSDISSMIACLTPPKWISEASSWRFHFLGVLPRLCSSLRGIGPNLKQNICMRDWGKVIFRLFVSKLSFPSVGMGTWKLARHPFGFTPRVFGMCSLHYVLWRIFCELQENNGPLYMLSRFLASKKNGLAGFSDYQGPHPSWVWRVFSQMHSGTTESAYHQLSQSSENQAPTLTFGFSLA